MNLEAVFLKIKKKTHSQYTFSRFQHSGSAVIYYSKHSINTANQHPEVSGNQHLYRQQRSTTTLHIGFGGNQQLEQHSSKMGAEVDSFSVSALFLQMEGDRRRTKSHALLQQVKQRVPTDPFVRCSNESLALVFPVQHLGSGLKKTRNRPHRVNRWLLSMKLLAF